MPPLFDEEALRFSVPLVLGLLAALALDRLTARRGLTPPGFREPWRRVAAFVLTAGLFWVGVTGPLAEIGRHVEIDVSQLTTPRLFFLHSLMIFAVLAWFALGYAGVLTPGRERGEDEGELSPVPEEMPAAAPAPAPPASLGRQLAAQFGFVTPNVAREIGLGLALGIAAWVAVLVGVIVIGLILVALGGEKAIPQQPPSLIPWIAALPLGVRLLLSLSAGIVEEWFFRGFLQPRMGILLSTGFFVLAHFSYGQPFMLIGITILSLIYALLVRWRQNIWPAIAAHALFDAVQLLVVIPVALRFLGEQGEGARKAAFLFLGLLGQGF